MPEVPYYCQVRRCTPGLLPLLDHQGTASRGRNMTSNWRGAWAIWLHRARLCLLPPSKSHIAVDNRLNLRDHPFHPSHAASPTLVEDLRRQVMRLQ